MNAFEQLSMFESMPIRHTKHQGVFSKYAASLAALEDPWAVGQAGHGLHGATPMTPMTPHSSLSLGPDSFNPALDGMDPVKKEEGDTFFSPASHEGTISPDDLLAVENSPLFDSLDTGDMQNWESLFLEGSQETNGLHSSKEQILAEPQVHNSPQPLDSRDVAPSSPSFEDNSSALDFELANLISAQASGSDRRTSPTATAFASPALGGVSKMGSPSALDKATKTKVDDLGITVYKRKPRSLPLKPVEVPEDDGDGVAAKRAKNTEAARRSRARKLERMSQLEERVRELLDENERLRVELAHARSG